MVIFHGYVSLPEGNSLVNIRTKVEPEFGGHLKYLSLERHDFSVSTTWSRCITLYQRPGFYHDVPCFTLW